MTTDDRIRDIYKDDDLKELERLYYRVDAEVEKSKGRRIKLLFVGFFIGYFILFWAIDQPDSLYAVSGTFLVALFLSPVHTFIHMSLFSWFISMQRQDNDRREFIEKRIQFAKERIENDTPYDRCYAAGYEKGRSFGYDEGYTVGYKIGQHEGYEEGLDKGLDPLCREGLCEGYDKGYRKGYHDARIDLDNGVYEDDYDDDDDEEDENIGNEIKEKE